MGPERRLHRHPHRRGGEGLIRALLVALVVVAAALPLAAAAPTYKATVSNRVPGPVVPDVPNDDDPSRDGRQVAPIAGTTSTVQVTMTATDDNGFNDLASVKITVYEPDNSTVHVSELSAGRTAGSGKTATYATSFAMDFDDDPGVYVLKAVAADRKGASSTGWTTFEYASLAAVGLSASSILLDPGGRSDGSVAPGGSTHVDPSPVSVLNRGNVAIDLRYSATAMTSGDASIPAGNVHFSASSAMTDERTIGSAPATDAAFDLAAGSSSSRDLWFAVHVPEGTPVGEYSGTLALVAVEDG